MATKISWAKETINPIVGCTHATDGCRNCYAERMAGRQANMTITRLRNGETSTMGQIAYLEITKWRNGGNHPAPCGCEQDGYDCPGIQLDDVALGKWNGQVRFVESALQKPLRRKKPTVFFVCSMSDLFHPEVKFNWLAEIFGAMAVAGRLHGHTFIIATKRPNFARNILDGVKSDLFRNAVARAAFRFAHNRICAGQIERDIRHPGYLWPLPNAKFLFSASTQRDLETGIDDHLATPAAWRGLSLEPLLGAIDLEYPNGAKYCCDGKDCGCRGMPIDPPLSYGINTCIVGCESGPGRRLNSDYWLNDLGSELWMSWLLSIIDQCDAAGVPVHVKQIPIADGSKIGWRVSKDPSEWPEWAQRRDDL
jgi:protein gp37